MAFRRLSRSSSTPSYGRAKFLSKFSSILITLILIGIVLVVAVVLFFIIQVPSPEQLSNRDIASATKIYDRNGDLLYDIYKNENRTPIKLAEIPNVVKQSTIAIEDKDFYKHQ